MINFEIKFNRKIKKIIFEFFQKNNLLFDIYDKVFRMAVNLIKII